MSPPEGPDTGQEAPPPGETAGPLPETAAAAPPRPAPPPPGRGRPGRVRRWVVRPFVWGIVLFAAVLVGTFFFAISRFARAKVAELVIARTSEFLHRSVRVRDVEYTFLPLAVELHDVEIAGPRPTDPPVARAALVRIQSSWRPLRRRVLSLDQIDIVRPHVYLQFNPDGSNNLPEFRSTGGGPRRIDVQIGRILVQDGVFQLNERRAPLTLDARAVWGRLIGIADKGGAGGTRLDALITAQEMVTSLPAARPYPLTVSVKGSILAEQKRIQIAAVHLAGPELSAQVDGDVSWEKGARRIGLRFAARGATRVVNRLGYLAEPIDGPFDLRGRFDLAGTRWRLSGTAGAPRVAILRRAFQDLRAGFVGGPDEVRVDVQRAGYAGGTLAGLVVVELRGAERKGRGRPVDLDLTFSGLAVETALADQFPRQFAAGRGARRSLVELASRASGRFRYRFDSSLPLFGTGQGTAHFDAAPPRPHELAVAGDAPFALARGQLSSARFQLTMPGQEVSGSGFRVDLDRGAGSVGFHLVSRDLGGLSPILPPPAPGEAPPFWFPTGGQGEADGSFEFDPGTYALHLAMDLAPVRSPDVVADHLRGALTLRPTAVDDLRLEMARGRGALLVSGRVPLAPEGKAAAVEPLVLAIDAAQWQASALIPFLPAVLPPVEGGEVTGQLDLRGPAGRLSGHARAEIADLVLGGVRLHRVRGDVTFDAGNVRVERGVVETPAGSVLVQGGLDQVTERLDLTVDAPALSLAAAPLSELTGDQLAGRLSLAAAVSGTLARPQATVELKSSGLALSGRTIGDAGAAQALLSWDGETVHATGSFLGLATFEGGGRLDLRRGADLALDLRSDKLGALARLASPQPLPEFTGSLLGTLGFTADFPARAYHGELRLVDLRAQFQGRTIANKEPVVAVLTPAGVEVRSFYLSEAGTDNDLFLSGTVGLAGAKPLDLHLQSTVSATWAKLLVPDLDLAGQVDVLATARGTLASPLLSGQAELHDARLIAPGFPQAFDDLQGTVLLYRDRLVLDRLRARLGGGILTVNGSLELPGQGRQQSYRVNFTARDVSVRYPEGFLSSGDADLALLADGRGRQIVGRINLRRAFYLENVQVDTLELLRGALQHQRLKVPSTNEFLVTTQLNLDVHGPRALQVHNNVAQLRGDVDLNVRGSMARPVVFGDVVVEPGGKLVYSGNEYKIERARLAFSNPNEIDPFIDVALSTEVRNFEIRVGLSGTLSGRITPTFSSDANLADLDILSLLTTGREFDTTTAGTPINGAGVGTAPGQQVGTGREAESFLYGQAASAVTQRVGTLFGFDRFRVDPLAAEGGQAIAGVGFTVGKRLSKDVFVTYTTNPSTSQQYLVQLEWRVASNFTVLLSQTGKGGYALDVQWENRF
jgi:uncharacterized protein involved in outer membrane biogenesis